MTVTTRPQTLDELIGQEALKRKARIAIGAALQRGEPLPHVVLTSSGGGLGKSTFATILANEMFCPLVSTTGQCLVGASDLRNVIVRLKPHSLLFVDEFHGVGKLAAEELLLVLEDGVLNVSIARNCAPIRVPVPPFTLIAATTKPDAISGPLRQRFGLHFNFDFYEVADLRQIVSRMAENLGVTFDGAVCQGIAERALGIPRIALRHAERVRDVAQARSLTTAMISELEIAMQLEGIDGLGLRRDHRQILQTLAAVDPRPVSARSLSLALGVEVATVTDVLEPTLVRLGLVTIGTGGRRITEVGIEHLQRVEKSA